MANSNFAGRGSLDSWSRSGLGLDRVLALVIVDLLGLLGLGLSLLLGHFLLDALQIIRGQDILERQIKLLAQIL